MKMPRSRIRKLQDFMTGNMRLKLLSLAVAFCIWSFMALSRESRYELSLPLQVRNVPNGYALAETPPAEIQFTLAGPYVLVESARRSNNAVILSLRGVSVPGRTAFSSLEANLKLPEGVKVIRTSPSLLTLDLIRKSTQQPEGDLAE